MKIAIFSDTFLPQPNGVANFVYQSAQSLAERGHEVCVFTVCHAKHKALVTSCEKINVIILPSLPAGAYSGERLTLPMGAAFKKLKKFQPDIIHSHTPFAVGWEAVWGAKILKTALVGTHHTFYDHYLKHIKADYNWVKRFSWKYTVAYYNRCDLVLSPSQSLADVMSVKGLKKPIAVLQNFIDTGFFLPPASACVKNELKKEFGVKGKSLVYMGRVSYEKSIDQVLKAFALVLKKNPSLQLMIVGDGPERNNLEKLAVQLGIKSKVIFTGLLLGEKLVKALQANEIFVTASKSENMPLSVLEAMAVGLPMITVQEKGLAELIKDGVNGFFVPSDQPQALAEKILELIGQSKTLEKFSIASRELANKYSKENVTCLLEKAYEQALKFKKEK